MRLYHFRNLNDATFPEKIFSISLCSNIFRRRLNWKRINLIEYLNCVLKHRQSFKALLWRSFGWFECSMWFLRLSLRIEMWPKGLNQQWWKIKSKSHCMALKLFNLFKIILTTRFQDFSCKTPLLQSSLTITDSDTQQE